jgi:hypothetical protein
MYLINASLKVEAGGSIPPTPPPAALAVWGQTDNCLDFGVYNKRPSETGNPGHLV